MLQTTGRKKVLIVSAHEGAGTWVNLCCFIGATTRYDVRSFHEFDDAQYRGARSRLERLALRLKTFVIFPLRFLWHARRLTADNDLLVVVTSPFFMPIIAAFVVRRSDVRVIALMNDIYPEALVAKGLLKRNGPLERAFKRLMGSALRRLSAVVFITGHHKLLVSHDVSLPADSSVIPVSAHSDPFRDVLTRPHAGPVDVTYCGTLGLMHDTATFIRWLERHPAHQDVRFLFHTSGASKEKFQNDVRSVLANPRVTTAVQLRNSLNETEWVEVMLATQVGLVFQDSGSGKVIFPSKLASILAAGQAVLAVADLDSEVARLVLENDCGWVVAPGDVAGFESCVAQMSRSDELAVKRRNAFVLGQARFGKSAIASQWVQLFDRLSTQAQGQAPR